MPAKIPPRKFSRGQKAFMLTAAFLASAAIPGVVGAPMRYVESGVAEAPGMLYAMHKDEVLYLSRPEYDRQANEWTVRGIPSADANWRSESLVFKLKRNLLTDAWSLAAHKGNYVPERVVAPITSAKETWTPYRVTYHDATYSFLQSGIKDATLLEVKEMPKEEPKVPRSGIPFYWPPGTWNKAFTPF